MIPAILPIGYIASRTRSYLRPLALAIGLVVVAQIGAVLGWGPCLPWAILAVAAGLARAERLAPASIAATLAGGFLGAAATIPWWRIPDAGL